MRLFLFDNNVKEEGGGHIYPWDMQFILAAMEKGFDTFFVVRKDFQAKLQEVTVIKAYSTSEMNNMLNIYLSIARRFPFIIKLKNMVKTLLRLFCIKYQRYEQQIYGRYQTPSYIIETEKVYREWDINKDDFVFFNYISPAQLRQIKSLYQTIKTEKIPNTCLYLSETSSNLLCQTDEDYRFSLEDNELKDTLDYFFSINSKLCTTSNYRTYFEILLNNTEKIIDVQLMSFGSISREKVFETRNNIEKKAFLQIGTMGRFDETHGADILSRMLPNIVEKINNKRYKIKFNIKTEKNYQTASNVDSYRKIKKLNGKNVICTDNKKKLPAEDYFRRFKEQDVIFLPYSNYFKYAMSGVLCEAYELGKPVIVSAGTVLCRTIKKEQFDYLSQVEIKKVFDEKSVTTEIIVEGKEEQTLITADNLLNKHYGLLKMSSSVPGGRMRKETSVSIFIYELDKNGTCLRRRERLIESNDNREFMSLIKLMNETEKIIVKVSNADTIYAIDLFNIHILFSEDKDIRLGVIGLDFTSEEDLFDVIEEIYLNYDHYADTARAHGEKWSEEHSAEKMLDDWMKAE